MGQEHHSHYAPFQTGGLGEEFISGAPECCGLTAPVNATAWNHISISIPFAGVCHDVCAREGELVQACSYVCGDKQYIDIHICLFCLNRTSWFQVSYLWMELG